MQAPNAATAGGAEDFFVVLPHRKTPWYLGASPEETACFGPLCCPDLITWPGAHSVTARINAELKYGDAE